MSVTADRHISSRVPSRWGLKALCLIPTLTLAASHSLPHEASESLATLVNTAFQNLYGHRYVQVLELVTVDDEGRQLSRRVMQILRENNQFRGRALMRITEPPSLSGTAALFLSEEAGSSDVYVYLPALRVSRRVSGAQEGDRFFGTSLSYSDFLPKSLSDFQKIEWAPSRDGEGCKGIGLQMETPKSEYDRMELCVDTLDATLRTISFIRDDSERKHLLISHEKNRIIGSRIVPYEFSVTSRESRTTTIARTLFYEEAKEIPDAAFTKSNMERGTPRGDRRLIKAGL